MFIILITKDLKRLYSCVWLLKIVDCHKMYLKKAFSFLRAFFYNLFYWLITLYIHNTYIYNYYVFMSNPSVLADFELLFTTKEKWNLLSINVRGNKSLPDKVMDIIKPTNNGNLGLLSISWLPWAWKWKFTDLLIWSLWGEERRVWEKKWIKEMVKILNWRQTKRKVNLIPFWNKWVSKILRKLLRVNELEEVSHFEYLHVLWEILKYPWWEEVFVAVFWLDAFMEILWPSRRGDLLLWSDGNFREGFINVQRAREVISDFLFKDDQIHVTSLYSKSPEEKNFEYARLLQRIIQKRWEKALRLGLIDCVNSIFVIEELLQESNGELDRDQILHFMIYPRFELALERMLYRDVIVNKKGTIDEAIKFRVMEQFRVVKAILKSSIELSNEKEFDIHFIDVSPHTKRKLKKSHIREAINTLERLCQDEDEYRKIFIWDDSEFEDFKAFAYDYISRCLEYFKSLKRKWDRK